MKKYYINLGANVQALRFKLHAQIPDDADREFHDAIDHRLYEIAQLCMSLGTRSKKPPKPRATAFPEPAPPPPPVEQPADESPPTPPLADVLTPPPADVPRPPKAYGALAPQTLNMQQWRDQMKLLESTAAAYNRHIEFGKTQLAGVDGPNKRILLNDLVAQGKVVGLIYDEGQAVFLEDPTYPKQAHPY
ncbi:hypothetical protein [Fibrella aestuarina]|uniref:hypothetical protein n=1 Tax=Fibrella aestuarina TaxID=651143 RepID=UPI00030AC8D6|nr:hypothetical protein [Fibrella aestuarina]